MTEPRDLLEFRPLPNPHSDEPILDEDSLLGAALHDLYPSEPARLREGSWDELEATAREVASERRRKYLAKRLMASLGPRRLVAYAAAAVLILGFFMATGFSLRRTAPPPPRLNDLHATIAATETNPRDATLRNGAVINVMGEAAVDQSGSAGVQVELHSGAVHASVPKLPPGQTFVVMTPHAEVTVHGTRFTVQQSPEGNTTVSVDEGLVAVRPLDGHRPTLWVRPGESVTVKPFPAYFAELEAEVAHAEQTEDCNDPKDLVAKYIEAAPPTADVSVAHYLLGVCAVQRGDRATAIEQFDLAAKTSITKARADNALARAAQLRAAQSEREGAEAWRDYLQRFPNGLHTDLARQFLAERAGGAGDR